MGLRLQFGGWLLALGMSAMVAAPCYAQRERANWAQNRPANKPPKEQRQERRQQQGEARRAQTERRQNENVRRPSEPNPNRPDSNARLNNNPNRPPSAYTPPQRNFNSLNPQERQRVLEKDRQFQKLPPQQKQELRDRARIWGQLTPEQQSHIRNDIVPKWQQMPPDRQRAIRQRLGVLQNMPESARNQHLNDPNFTHGMSEEDKALLRDLSHMHVGSPDRPNE